MKSLSTLIKTFLASAAFVLICAFTVSPVNAATAAQTDGTKTTAGIIWDAPDNSACYYIGWGTTPEKAKKMADKKEKKIDGKYSSYVIEGLEPGTKYFVYINYKVQSTGIIEKLVEDLQVQTAPKKVTNVKLDSIDYNLRTATVKWDTQAGAAGYEYVLKDNSGKTIATEKVSSGSESVVKLDIKNNTFYKFQVRGYFNRFERDIYGDWSKTLCFGAQPEITKATATSKGLSLKWNKVSGAKEYAVYISTKANKGYKKIATTSSTSYTLKKLNDSKISKSKTYYVYVIASKKDGSKTIKSLKTSYNAIKGSQVDLHNFE